MQPNPTADPAPRQSTRWLGLVSAFVAIALAGCASPSNTAKNDQLSDTINASAWAKSNALPTQESGARWNHQSVGNRPTSQYTPLLHVDRPALEAHSKRGDSLIRMPLKLDGPQLGRIQFSWFVNALNEHADLADSQYDDSVVRVILQFGGDRAAFSARDSMVSELIRALTGEPLPFATLMYVWDHRYPAGTVIPHARSQRIKMLVVESGEGRLGRWIDIERDIAADYQMAFGHAPQSLDGLALMTDSNNTQKAAKAWYGPLVWQPSPQ